MQASARDLQRLQGVHPKLAAIITQILNELPMFVAQGVRTVAQQQALYAQGRTAPGHIVTYKDGINYRSNHQPHPDGLGYAVDLAWLGAEPFSDIAPWGSYGEKVESAGLIWGGRWKMVDRPHAELSA
jgi:peptidoglycan LD-endopeptidase CwlK